jgi:hypothetical protein
MRLGQPLADLSAGWPKSTRHHAYHYTGLGKADYHYTGLGAGWPEQKKPSYRYTGLGAGWPEQKKPSYRYTGLGATDADRVAAQAAYVACRAACAIAGPACQAACDATYAAAQAAMQSPGCDAACMRAKIDNIASAPVAHGVPSGSSGSTRTGSSSSSDTSADTGAPPAEDNTMLYVGGAALLAVIGYAVWSEMKDRKQYGR